MSRCFQEMIGRVLLIQPHLVRDALDTGSLVELIPVVGTHALGVVTAGSPITTGASDRAPAIGVTTSATACVLMRTYLRTQFHMFNYSHCTDTLFNLCITTFGGIRFAPLTRCTAQAMEEVR